MCLKLKIDKEAPNKKVDDRESEEVRLVSEETRKWISDAIQGAVNQAMQASRQDENRQTSIEQLRKDIEALSSKQESDGKVLEKMGASTKKQSSDVLEAIEKGFRSTGKALETMTQSQRDHSTTLEGIKKLLEGNTSKIEEVKKGLETMREQSEKENGILTSALENIKLHICAEVGVIKEKFEAHDQALREILNTMGKKTSVDALGQKLGAGGGLTSTLGTEMESYRDKNTGYLDAARLCLFSSLDDIHRKIDGHTKVLVDLKKAADDQTSKEWGKQLVDKLQTLENDICSAITNCRKTRQ